MQPGSLRLSRSTKGANGSSLGKTFSGSRKCRKTRSMVAERKASKLDSRCGYSQRHASGANSCKWISQSFRLQGHCFQGRLAIRKEHFQARGLDFSPTSEKCFVFGVAILVAFVKALEPKYSFRTGSNGDLHRAEDPLAMCAITLCFDLLTVYGYLNKK